MGFSGGLHRLQVRHSPELAQCSRVWQAEPGRHTTEVRLLKMDLAFSPGSLCVPSWEYQMAFREVEVVSEGQPNLWAVLLHLRQASTAEHQGAAL